MKRGFLVFFLVTLLLISIGAVSGAQTYRPRLANITEQGVTWAISSDYYAELVAEKTNGRMTIRTFHGGVLGSLRENLESLQLGTLEMCLPAMSWIMSFVPEAGLFEVPYLWEDYDHYMRAVVEGSVGEIMAEILLENGFRVLGWTNAGTRNILLKQPKTSLADFRGVKVRAPAVDVYMRAKEFLGASPTPTAWVDVYSALQTGLVDGAANSYSLLHGAKLHEVAKYLHITEHIMAISAIVADEKWFQKLPLDIQEAMIEAGKELPYFDIEQVKQEEEKLKKDFEEKYGVTIIEIDTSEIIELAKQYQIEYAEKLGMLDLLEEIWKYRDGSLY